MVNNAPKKSGEGTPVFQRSGGPPMWDLRKTPGKTRRKIICQWWVFDIYVNVNLRGINGVHYNIYIYIFIYLALLVMNLFYSIIDHWSHVSLRWFVDFAHRLVHHLGNDRVCVLVLTPICGAPKWHLSSWQPGDGTMVSQQELLLLLLLLLLLVLCWQLATARRWNPYVLWSWMKLDLLDASRATWGVVGQAMTRIRVRRNRCGIRRGKRFLTCHKLNWLYSSRSLRDHGGVPANQTEMG